MTPGHRARQVANLVNGSTAAGACVALAGGARLARGADGLLMAVGYRPAVPVAPAFTLGNVIVSRRTPLPSAVLAHEARHATQYAWCAGLVMLPLYFAAAGVSWILCGDLGAWNVFERLAGLADGGYTARPIRPALAGRISGRRRPAGVPDGGGGQGSVREQAGPAESTATSSP